MVVPKAAAPLIECFLYLSNRLYLVKANIHPILLVGISNRSGIAMAYRSPWVSDELETFRGALRKFLERELAPHAAQWRAQKRIDRSAWRALGEMGALRRAKDRGRGRTHFHRFVHQATHHRGLGAITTSMAKLWCAERQIAAIDQCMQMHGGYGYMAEYPIARMYADARIQKIYGGTNGIMACCRFFGHEVKLT